MLIAMPHCGLRPNSTSGGEVTEREVLKRVHAYGVQAHIYPPRWRGLRWWNSIPYFAPSLRQCITRHGAALIRAHSLRYTGLAALWAGDKYHLPVSVHYHHLERDRLSWLDRFVLRRANQVTTDSGFSAGQVRKWGVWATVVRLGVDHERFKPTPRPAWNSRLVLLIGGMKTRKNAQFVRQLPGVRRLVEAGEGMRRSDTDMVALYRAARVVVMPSTLEGFGLPVLEAMACGRPVVCSDRGALPEFGIETTPLIPELWRERIDALMCDDALWQKEAERNLELAKAYSWDKTADDFAHVWTRA